MIYYGLVITGTDTGVGKTELGCGLARAFRARGVRIGVFKPIETGRPEEAGQPAGEDAKRLIAASGCGSSLEKVSPYRFKLAAAPLAAARAEGREILFEKIYQVFDELAGEHELMIVEGAGGLLVPANENFLFADLILPMQLPLLIVAEDRLGVIGRVLLTLEAARSRGLEILGVALNQTQPGAGTEKLRHKELIEEFGKTQVLARIGYLAPAGREEEMARICGELAERIEPRIRELGRQTVLKYL